MKRIISVILLIAFVFSNVVPVHSAITLKPDKAKGGGGNSSDTLVVNGSILNSSKNIIKTKKLAKDVLMAIQSEGLENVSVQLIQLVSEGESTDIFTLGHDGIELKGKKLILNLFANLVNSAGAVVTAGALPTGEYRITVVIGDEEFDVNQTVRYNTPVIVTGTAEDCGGGGTQQVTDLNGDDLSRLVALTSNCVYINEVTADTVPATTPAQRKFLNQEENTSSSGEVVGESSSSSGEVVNEPPAIVEVVTAEGNELLAPVELDPENNGAVEVNPSDDTTFEVENIVNLANVEEGEDLNNNEQVVEGIADLIEEDIQGDGNQPPVDGEACKTAFFDIFTELCALSLPADLNNGQAIEEFVMSIPQDTLVSCGMGIAQNIGSFFDVFVELPLRNQETGSKPKGCIPPFVTSQIIPSLSLEEDFAKFASKFIFNGLMAGMTGPDPRNVCEHLEQGSQNRGMGGPNPPPPCVPLGIREIVKNECPDLLSSLPERGCEEGAQPCEMIGGPSSGGTSGTPAAPPAPPPPPGGIPGSSSGNTSGGTSGTPAAPPPPPPPPGGISSSGTPPAGTSSGQPLTQITPPVGTSSGQPAAPPPPPTPPQGCFDIMPIGPSDLCMPCQTNDDCKNPVRILTPNHCLLPGTICGDETDPFGTPTGNMVCILETLDVSTLTAEGADLTKQPTHMGGPVDPFSCREYGFMCGEQFNVSMDACNPFGPDMQLNPNFILNCCAGMAGGNPGLPPARISLQVGGTCTQDQLKACIESMNLPLCSAGVTPEIDPTNCCPSCRPEPPEIPEEPTTSGQIPPATSGQPPTLPGGSGPIDPFACICKPENFGQDGMLLITQLPQECIPMGGMSGPGGMGGFPPGSSSGQFPPPGGSSSGGFPPGSSSGQFPPPGGSSSGGCQCPPPGGVSSSGGFPPPPPGGTSSGQLPPPPGGTSGGQPPPPPQQTLPPPDGSSSGGQPPPPPSGTSSGGCQCPPPGGASSSGGFPPPPPGGTSGGFPPPPPGSSSGGQPPPPPPQ